MSPDEELEALLSEPVASAIERGQKAFNLAAGAEGRDIVLFGAGGVGRRTLKGLRQASVEPIAWADNGSSLWGTEVMGLPVFSPAEAAKKYGESAVFVPTIWRGEPVDGMRDHIAFLKSLGCKTVVSFALLYWKYADYLLPHYSLDLPHKVLENADIVRAALDGWSDDESRSEFVAQIRWRLTQDPESFTEPLMSGMYFPESICPLRNDEVFIDCRAFDGDTIEDFLAHSKRKFRQIVSFEPDAKNLEVLRKRVSELDPDIQARVRIEPFAVGDETKSLRFSSDGTYASSVTDDPNATTIECVDLDHTILADKPTYVKIDIEGYELEAIRGASRILAEKEPVLAVCSCHKQAHIWEIPNLIRSINPKYNMYLRRYAVDAWESVTYAIPDNRRP